MAISRICFLKRLPQQLPQSALAFVGLAEIPSSKQADVDASLQSLLQATCQPIRKADQISPSQQQAVGTAANMLAWNVFMAPHVSSALPRSAKQHLQEGTIFNACCQALLHLSSPEHESKISTTFVDDPAAHNKKSKHHATISKKLTWNRCAWAVANLTQLAAGEPVHRTLVRHLQPVPVPLAFFQHLTL